MWYEVTEAEMFIKRQYAHYLDCGTLSWYTHDIVEIMDYVKCHEKMFNIAPVTDISWEGLSFET